MNQVILAVISWAVSAPCWGQIVFPVEFEAQANMMAPQGSVQGCGFRFVGSRPYEFGATIRADTIDGSLMAFSAGVGAVKAGWNAMQSTSGKITASPTNRPIKWIRIDGHEPIALADGKPVPTEDAGYSMFTTDAVLALSSLMSMSEGKNLWVAFSGADRRDTIFSGRVKVAPAVLEEFEMCVGALAAAVKRE